MNTGPELNHRRRISTRRALLPAIAVSFAVSASAGPAEASEREVSVVLRAPKRCPTRDVLLRDAKARVPALRFSDDDASVGVHAAIRVDIAAKPRGFGATIEMERDGVVERRSLVADSCGELVEAAGLLIALFVKPAAPDAPAPAESEEPGEAREAPPRTEPDLREEPRAGASRARETPPSKPERGPSRSYGVFAGANIQTEAATFPALALGAGLFVGVERSSGVLAPSLRLEAALASSDPITGPHRRGSLVRGTLRVDGCPIRIAIGAHLSLRPCVWAGAGVVRASGTAVENAQADTEGWADLGARLRARLEAAHLFAELDAGALAPLTRPTIITQNPTEVVHETPAIGALFSIGAGYRFF